MNVTCCIFTLHSSRQSCVMQEGQCCAFHCNLHCELVSLIGSSIPPSGFSFQVVMAVAQLYFHLAPKAEVGVIAKALVRLLRSHR